MTVRVTIMRTQFLVVLFMSIVFSWGRFAVAAPTVGDTYVYRVTNAYNNEARGQVTYRVDKVDPDQVTVTVTPDSPSLGRRRTRTRHACSI